MKKTVLLLTAIAFLLLSGSLLAQTNYYRVVGGIPHLPVFANTAAAATAAGAGLAPGMVVYSDANCGIMVYTGSVWTDLCTGGSYTANAGYFRVVAGIPVLPVSPSAVGPLQAGGMYVPTVAGSKLQVYNGSAWADFDAVSSLAANSGTVHGPGFRCPVLAAAPSGSKGAFYLGSTNNMLYVFDGSIWKTVMAPALAAGDVYSPCTGRVWKDRNLGAAQVATSSTDAASYGDLYQWGRLTDGHQIRTSVETTTLSSTDIPGHAKYIVVSASPTDWRSGQNDNLWQGVGGINNPCPNGYRLPTQTEFIAEYNTWTPITSDGAFASPLALTIAGRRSYNGALWNVGEYGYYWTSTIIATASRSLSLTPTAAQTGSNQRAYGFSVRCIKD